jgi:hypothetical protein
VVSQAGPNISFRTNIRNVAGTWTATQTFAAITGTTGTFSGLVFIGDTANGEMTLGLTVNQADNDDVIFGLKSSDTATGLSTGTLFRDVETDDFLTISKRSGVDGGAVIQVLSETGNGNGVLTIDAYGGAPQTTDTTGSNAIIMIRGAEHDGSNGLNDIASNGNLFAVCELNSGGSDEVRLLLKADDGELHLGNTTLVAMDDEDDVQLIRAMQRESSLGGVLSSQYDNPFYSYSKLLELGLAGEKDEKGVFLFPLQSRLHAHEGAMWQTYIKVRELEEKLEIAERKLVALGA